MSTKPDTSASPRRERAAATRRRLVEVAYRLMSSRGYMETTMADIATEAGVAVQTVYFKFHNKPAVLRAVWAFAVKGDHLPSSPIERPWFAEMAHEPDHERALTIFVDATTEIFRRVMPLTTVFKAFGDDPEIADFFQLSGRWQRDGYRVVVDTLARRRQLRAGLSPDDATTILLVLLGIDVYRMMLEDHGWAEQKWRSWVIETLLEALFGQVQPPAASRAAATSRVPS